MIDKITINHLLPKVFEGMEDSSQIRNSHIWNSPPFSFERGCKICIYSESGGGKSSLLSFIYGNRQDYLGDIFFNNQNIKTIDIKHWCEIRKNGIALLPQDMRLFPELTAIENILLKNRLTQKKTEKEIIDLFEILDIKNKIDTMVSKLSIGQQQRVAIIRSLCQPFDFIFLDEPVSHLDEKNNKIVANLIEDEALKSGAGIISTSVGNHLLLDNPVFIRL